MSTINSSRLWRHCKVLQLKQNMRLQLGNNSDDQNDIEKLAKWILALGDEMLGSYNDGESVVEMLEELLISRVAYPIDDMVAFAYLDIISNVGRIEYFQDKAILAPTLEIVRNVNEYVMSLLPSDNHEYLSLDSILKVDEDIGIHANWLTTEFLNDIKCSYYAYEEFRYFCWIVQWYEAYC